MDQSSISKLIMISLALLIGPFSLFTIIAQPTNLKVKGRVVQFNPAITAPNNTIPLRGARVELCECRRDPTTEQQIPVRRGSNTNAPLLAGKVLYHSTTNKNGYFLLRDVRAEKYCLRITLGEYVMQQYVDDNSNRLQNTKQIDNIHSLNRNEKGDVILPEIRVKALDKRPLLKL